MKEVGVGIIGATGAVGQRYISMLSRHPYFRIRKLMGGKSAGKRYSDSTSWIIEGDIPEEVADERIAEAKPESAKECELIFSAVPSEVAKEIEPKFASSGFFVVSEASAHRMDDDVPLMIPEVNSEHLALLKTQREKRRWKGGLVTTPNCTTTGLAMVLKPLHDVFQISKVVATTMQAVSGAGYQGVPSMAIIENVIPFIKGEEEKVVRETKKILGKMNYDSILQEDIKISVSCNRVSTLDGHLETVYLETKDSISVEGAKNALRSFSGLPQRDKFPTAPKRPIIVREEADRPQPRLDRLSGTVPGMSVVVGRVRKEEGNALQLTLLAHNTIRGAAGNAILTAELIAETGYLE
ncbi:MAG: aspartate-semialdehyde dehydrogenase [Conexivisphaerales archaeon]